MTPCELCRGACCESLVVPLNVGLLSNQDRRYFRVRGTIEGSSLRVQARCSILGDDGRCREYDARPEACRRYEVGSDACVAAIRSQRVQPDAEAILALLP